jgi:hypothetical protein
MGLRVGVTGRPADRGAARSLSTLLDVRADEVFGVLLENIVDLVEQVVSLLGQLLATLLPGGRAAGEVIVLAATTATLGLLLSHRCLLRMSSAGSQLPAGYSTLAQRERCVRLGKPGVSRQCCALVIRQSSYVVSMSLWELWGGHNMTFQLDGLAPAQKPLRS